MLDTLLLGLIVASWLYWVVACWWLQAFFRRGIRPASAFAPPVSILKAVRGVDPCAYENFASFCRQEYPEFEILFGVADAADPVIPLIERLIDDFPGRRIRLYIAPPLGANQKASILHHLALQAQYGILAVSDSDVRVTPAYLRRVVAPLADPQVGLVTCPYRGEMPLTLTARLEGLHMSMTFMPSVAVARRFLSMSFALGASITLRRADLTRLGGFAAICDYLADDYQIGARIAGLGLRVELSDYVVTIVLGATTFREQWEREARWARCSRVSRPLEYPGLLLTFSTPLSVLFACVTDSAYLRWEVVTFSLLLRWSVGWLASGALGDREARRWLIWLPVRDMLSALIWIAGGLGRTVSWRGERYLLKPDGRLAASSPAVAPTIEIDGRL